MNVIRRITLVGILAVTVTAGCNSSARRSAGAPGTVAPTVTAPVQGTTSAPPTVVPTTSITVPPSSGCTNQAASEALDAALVQANGTPGGQTVPGAVYYGSCGTTAYAVARFQPGPDAPDPASFQDEGAAPHYFIRAQGGPWKLVADGANFPAHMRDCSTFAQLPAALRASWQDCPNG